MRILDDYVCSKCKKAREELCSRDAPPQCCKQDMQRVVGTVNHFEWGGPRTYLNCRDEPFSSRSELKAWQKENGLGEAGDKVGGARNEDRLKNNLFSYAGAPTGSRCGG